MFVTEKELQLFSDLSQFFLLVFRTVARFIKTTEKLSMLSLVIQGDHKRVSENNFHVLNSCIFCRDKCIFRKVIEDFSNSLHPELQVSTRSSLGRKYAKYVKYDRVFLTKNSSLDIYLCSWSSHEQHDSTTSVRICALKENKQ